MNEICEYFQIVLSIEVLVRLNSLICSQRVERYLTNESQLKNVLVKIVDKDNVLYFAKG